jgi:signal transduction histidine kinase/DNA-binding response OmpR family regulator
MQTPFRKLSIRKKLITFMMGITGLALFLYYVVSITYHFRAIQQVTVDNLDALTDIIVNMTSPTSTSFTRDWKDDMIKALRGDQDVEKGVIFSADGSILATYINPAAQVEKGLPVTVKKEGDEFFVRNGIIKFAIFHPILLNGKRIGTLYLLLSLKNLTVQLARSAIFLLLSLVCILLLVLIFSSQLRRLITNPVSALAATARKITESGDYKIRLEKGNEDEIGALIDDFNTMLEVICQRDTELSEHKLHLEMQVEERTEQLRLKRDEALAAAKAKSEFLANMSHEIRTPMNGVIGVLSLLKDAPLSEEYRRLLQTATRSADSLLLIINDILDFSKIEAGKIDFESIVFDLRDLMEEVTLLFMEAANMKNIDLFCFVPTDVDTQVLGDPTRLRQIITNLLSNAIKFTEQGEVVLQVVLIKRQDGLQLLRFSVEDTGIGISPAPLKGLFTKFTQADGSTTRKYGGTGLGLSVCKQLVEMQNGEIGVDSEKGKGTIFWFTLPMKVVEDEIREASCEDLGGRNFLIVDDNATNRLIIEHYLRPGDVEVSSCETGDQAITAIKGMASLGKHFDTVLLDYHMPGKDGLQVAEEIRKEFGSDAPELVLLSSEGRVREKAITAGIKTIIYKPIRLNQFYNALSVRPKMEQEADSRIESQDHTPALQGEILLVDDEVINQKVGAAILKRIGIEPDIANNGKEALKMIEEKQYDLVLMDIQMPELSGFDATEEIRRKELLYGLSRIPIIAMTANAMESTRQQCLAIGMDDFIAKPIKPDILKERLEPWLKNRRSGSHEWEKPFSEGDEEEREEGKPADGKTWDKEKALQFVGGDESLLRDLATLFLQRSAALLKNVERAIETKDPAALHSAAHAYKGAVNHFSAARIRALAFALENKGRSGDLAGTQSLFDRLRQNCHDLQEELRIYAMPGGFEAE